jgi:NADPH:quinone reductase
VSERQNMRAVGFTEFGRPEVLGIVPLPIPSPGPGQVRVAAAAVNPTDLAFRAGAHRSMPAGIQPPYVPGMDLAGVIDAANAAGDWRAGDRVMAAVSPWVPGGGAQVLVSRHLHEADRLARLAEQAAKGVLTPRVADVLPAERAAQAHRRFAAHGVRGRLILAF